MVKDQHPEATKEAISSILPNWLSTFRQLLLGDLGAVAPQDGNWVHLAIKLQVYRVRELCFHYPELTRLARH
jgi:hypothetical protein